MCNGMCEKFNDTIKKMIKRLAAERPRDWDRYLAPALFAYREVPNETTGFSPFELLYGRDVRGPMHILKESWVGDETDTDTQNAYHYILDLKSKLADTCRLAQARPDANRPGIKIL